MRTKCLTAIFVLLIFAFILISCTGNGGMNDITTVTDGTSAQIPVASDMETSPELEATTYETTTIAETETDKDDDTTSVMTTDIVTSTETEEDTATVDTYVINRHEAVPDDEGEDTAPVIYLSDNLVNDGSGDFDSLDKIGQSEWTAPFGGTLSLAERDGGSCLYFTGISQSWVAPAINLRNYIDTPGRYRISLRVSVESSTDSLTGNAFSLAIRGDKENSFMKNQGGNIFVGFRTDIGKCKPGEWYETGFNICVTKEDLESIAGTLWNFCLHEISADITGILIDDFTVSSYDLGKLPVSIPETAEAWVANEIVLNSVNNTDAPLYTTELDLELICGDVKLTVPGFWDGNNIWKIRFTLPFAGEWSFRTICTDKNDTGLEGIHGIIKCTEYTGELDIYKHGFVRTEPDKQYFVYDDGTPFLYLGDTHWSMPTEEYYSAGGNAQATETTSHFRYIVRKRVEQGFTVYQSEPLGATFNVTDGINSSDIEGFRELDKYFAYIAKHGLVHANAQFFFPDTMATWMKNDGFDQQLRVATRYWVARYSAYPVFWTLGQEVDKNFYTHLGTGENPYLKVCEYIHKYDAYAHPITAHQESTDYTKALDSAFLNAEGHTWFAAQWSPALNKTSDFSIASEYYGTGKVTVLYEGLYDHLWTNGNGARIQGWVAYLNGMYGYGYGAQDIWQYMSSYDIDTVTNRYGIRVNPSDKAIKWGDSVELDSAYQCGFMIQFFDNIDWWRLVPVFDDKSLYNPDTACYSAAHDGNDTYVVYLYGERKLCTGTVSGLDTESAYVYRWFNPRNGEYSQYVEFKTSDGTFNVGDKPDKNDWVLLIEKIK